MFKPIKKVIPKPEEQAQEVVEESEEIEETPEQVEEPKEEQEVVDKKPKKETITVGEILQDHESRLQAVEATLFRIRSA